MKIDKCKQEKPRHKTTRGHKTNKAKRQMGWVDGPQHPKEHTRPKIGGTTQKQNHFAKVRARKQASMEAVRVRIRVSCSLILGGPISF